MDVTVTKPTKLGALIHTIGKAAPYYKASIA